MVASPQANAFDLQPMTKYGTTLEYYCGRGSQFQAAGGGAATVESINATCGWDGAWRFTSPMSGGCRVTHCADPRDPSSDGRHLAFVDPSVTSSDALVPVGEVLEYGCEPGYLFDHDLDAEAFGVTCLEDGAWGLFPDRRCVLTTDKSCPAPPAPPANGGLVVSVTTSAVPPPYGSRVTYGCDVGRKLLRYVEDGDGYFVPEFYAEQVFTCGWEGAWQPTVPVRKLPGK